MRNFIYRILVKLSLIVKSKSDFTKYVVVDPSSFLLNGLNIRFDTEIEERKYVVIGREGIINANFIFETQYGDIQIGDNVHIGGATLISRNNITIGNDVTMAWGVTLYDHDSHSIYWGYRKNDNHQCYSDYHKFDGNSIKNKNWEGVNSAPITIGDKVWIGFDVCILKGVTIGEGAVVAAKSVVTKDVPAWTVAGGNPARVLKQIPHD